MILDGPLAAVECTLDVDPSRYHCHWILVPFFPLDCGAVQPSWDPVFDHQASALAELLELIRLQNAGAPG